jgi:cysteine desulfurase/selenocysteine lyase
VLAPWTGLAHVALPARPAVLAIGGLRAPAKPAPRPFDAESCRRDFPLLQEHVNGRPLVWLDNAATTQKPQRVIDRMAHFYRHENSNVHRAAHALAARATDAFEDARQKVRRFLNAGSAREIIFTRGTTEAINLVAQGWGRRHIGAGDEIILSWLEHHSNIVPWQMLAEERGARLRVIPIDDDGNLRLDDFDRLLNPRTRLVALTHVSNAIGAVTPIAEVVSRAKQVGARVLIDGAQAVSHMPVDVQAIGADFYVFSGHKVFGPTGIGVLRGRPDALDEMLPWQGGGNMIAEVTFERTVYQPAPARFEAGTGNVSGAVGLGAAIDYVSEIGMAQIEAHEQALLDYLASSLEAVPHVRIVGNPSKRAGALSFMIDGWRADDVGAALDREGIAVRSGHHCAQPALRRFGLDASVRPSVALYNTRADIDALIRAVDQLVRA